MNAKLTEIRRLITNLSGTGNVSTVDKYKWLCWVEADALETNWINWLTTRAGNTRTWLKTTGGKQVVVLSLNGNLETAFALPAIYFDAFTSPDYSETVQQPCLRTAAGFSTSRKPASCFK